jgi:ribosomal protein S6--L-glutamate ligase
VNVCFILERGVPPRQNPTVVETLDLLADGGVTTSVRYPDEELIRLDRLRPEADLYLLKSNTELALSLATALEYQGARVINTAEATARAKNKVVAAATLRLAGLPLPRSLVAGRPSQLAPELASGPLILKPHRGHYGAGVAVAATPSSLPTDDTSPDLVFAQRHLAGARLDLKVFAIGDTLCGVRKAFGPKSFLGAGVPVSLTSELMEIARRCGRAFGLLLFGLDVAETEGGPVIVDVNAFPGYRGVPDAARCLAQFVFDTVGAQQYA